MKHCDSSIVMFCIIIVFDAVMLGIDICACSAAITIVFQIHISGSGDDGRSMFIAFAMVIIDDMFIELRMLIMFMEVVEFIMFMTLIMLAWVVAFIMDIMFIMFVTLVEFIMFIMFIMVVIMLQLLALQYSEYATLGFSVYWSTLAL
jgi:hypothetical protein